MAVVATILVWLLGILGGLLVLVLVLPFSVRAFGELEPWRAAVEVDASWGFGLLGFQLTSRRSARIRVLGLNVWRLKERDEAKEEERKRRKKDKKEKAVEKKREKARKRGLRWALRNRTLFHRVVRALHIRAALRGAVGLGDPADTARLATLVDPVVGLLPGCDSRVYWEYVDEVLFIGGEIRARVWPVELAAILLTTLARGKSRRALLAKN